MSLLDDDGLLDLRRARAVQPAGAAMTAPEPARPAESPATTSPSSAHPLASAATTASRPLCGLCAARPARDRCVACGRLACAADLWVMLRLCHGCASDGDVARGQRGAQPESRNWLEGPR